VDVPDHDQDHAEAAPWRPSAARVAKRAVVLTCIAARAELEGHAGQAWMPERLGWLGTLVARSGVVDEFEPAERVLLDTPSGGLGEQAAIDAAWRLEGVAVLAWALRRFRLAAYDQQVDAEELLVALGVDLWSRDARVELLVEVDPVLRPRGELEALRDQQFAAHWRLRDFLSVEPRRLDFAAFAQTAWFGPLDLRGLPLIDGDLAVGGVPIDQAQMGRLQLAHSVVTERRRAAAWLCGEPPIYSEVPLDT
jgi:hypothetical protein